MLILILIDVQYSQKAVFSFEKGLNYQNHSSSGFLHLVKKSLCVCVWGGGREEVGTPMPYRYLENTVDIFWA